MRYLFVFLLVACVVFLGFAFSRDTASTSAARTPILVELFTSEGCSDCPPADAFLQKLDQQPFAKVEMIVLSEHVDYWNHDGWKDPYSSSAYTERQNGYVSEFALKGPYTPEMVVDGSTEFVGSNQAAAAKAFAKAVTEPKTSLRLSSISLDSQHTLHAHIEADALPKGEKGDVYVAVAMNHAENHVTAGENAGRTIAHTAVVREMKKVGSLKKDQPFAEDVQIKLPSDLPTDDLRLVAFIQQGHQEKVYGAAMLPVTAK